MKYRITERGFGLIKFKDRYGVDCDIQKSSLATEDAIWLGCHEDTRMHLTIDQVKDLIPILEYFVKNGDIPREV